MTFNFQVAHKVELKFLIKLEWNENRGTFFNLKDDSSDNVLHNDDMERLWIPYVIFDNTDASDAVILSTKVRTTIMIQKEGNFTRNPLTEVDEKYLYKGSENKLALRQTHTKRFSCIFMLENYPFDSQVCTITMVRSDVDKKNIRLMPSDLDLKVRKELTMYIIKKWDLVHLNGSIDSGVKMVVVFQRRIMNELLLTFLPSLILVQYSQTTAGWSLPMNLRLQRQTTASLVVF